MSRKLKKVRYLDSFLILVVYDLSLRGLLPRNGDGSTLAGGSK